MNKNFQTQSVEDKKKAYLYIAQLETLCVAVSRVVNRLSYENHNKNKSFIRGVYFTISIRRIRQGIKLIIIKRADSAANALILSCLIFVLIAAIDAKNFI